MGHELQHEFLVRTVLALEERLQGKKGGGRPRKMLLSWLLETKRKYNTQHSTKRNGTRQIKLASMKMETCPYKGRIQQRANFLEQHLSNWTSIRIQSV